MVGTAACGGSLVRGACCQPVQRSCLQNTLSLRTCLQKIVGFVLLLRSVEVLCVPLLLYANL